MLTVKLKHFIIIFEEGYKLNNRWLLRKVRFFDYVLYEYCLF